MIAKNPLISNGLHISDTDTNCDCDCDCIIVLATAQLRNAVSPPLSGSLWGLPTAIIGQFRQCDCVCRLRMRMYCHNDQMRVFHFGRCSLAPDPPSCICSRVLCSFPVSVNFNEHISRATTINRNLLTAKLTNMRVLSASKRVCSCDRGVYRERGLQKGLMMILYKICQVICV